MQNNIAKLQELDPQTKDGTNNLGITILNIKASGSCLSACHRREKDHCLCKFVYGAREKQRGGKKGGYIESCL